MNHISDAVYAPLNRETVQDLPTTTGIYIFRSGGELLYVGKSNNLRARVTSHIENARIDAKEAAIIEGSDNLGYIVTDSEFSALLLESELIQKNKPKYNSRWRDDKSYLYIKITKETYPKVYSVRRENDGKSLYFGPFSSQRSVLEILRYIRRVFPFCSQKKITKRGCFYSKIGLCNPCPSDIEKITDADIKKKEIARYKQNIRNSIKVLNGNTDLILKSLYRKLKELTQREQFEEAILVRNQIYEFERLIYQRSFRSAQDENYNRSEESLVSLTQILQPFFPELKILKRIECYDISNFGGKDSTASMVVFTEGLIDKSQYRRFRIKNLSLTSDFEMLQETLERRFKRSAWKDPDLVVIDGGKPQLAAVREVLQKMNVTVPFIGIAKHPDRLLMGTENFPTIRPPVHNMGFNMVRHIRDESHRFARKYHRFLRNKKILPI